MDNPLALINPLTALVAGFATSLHCMGMCGPLSCSLLFGEAKSKRWAIGGYHIGRLVSYTALGAISGALGARFVSTLTDSPTQLITWAMAAFFLAMALGLDRFALKFPALQSLGRAVTRQALKLNGGARGVSLGLATPLIPCGPLYLIVWVAALAGSAQGGGLMLACFGLGAIPGLVVAQIGWNVLVQKVAPRQLALWKRGILVAASLLLALRSVADISLEALTASGGICF